jgi:hypothetical protein
MRVLALKNYKMDLVLIVAVKDIMKVELTAYLVSNLIVKHVPVLHALNVKVVMLWKTITAMDLHHAQLDSMLVWIVAFRNVWHVMLIVLHVLMVQILIVVNASFKISLMVLHVQVRAQMENTEI